MKSKSKHSGKSKAHTGARVAAVLAEHALLDDAEAAAEKRVLAWQRKKSRKV